MSAYRTNAYEACTDHIREFRCELKAGHTEPHTCGGLRWGLPESFEEPDPLDAERESHAATRAELARVRAALEQAEGALTLVAGGPRNLCAWCVAPWASRPRRVHALHTDDCDVGQALDAIRALREEPSK